MSLHCFDEKINLTRTRSRIGVRDPDAVFGGGERDRLCQRQRGHGERMGGDQLPADLTSRRSGGELIRAAQRFIERFYPMFLESVLQGGDERAFDSHLDIMPMLRVLGVARPLFGEPNATGESDFSINHQNATVRAAIAAIDSPG